MATKFSPFNLSRIEKMKFQVRLWTAAALVTYISCLVYLVSPEFFFANLSAVRIIGWIIAATLAFYFTIGDLHNWLDKRFFHERAKVDTFIREELTSPCRAICERGKLGVYPSEEAQLINMFYNFIPADDTERERAFSYFTDYFVTVNLSVLSILGILFALAIFLFSPFQSPSQYLVSFLIAVVFPITSNLLRTKMRRKLQLPAAAQTKRILTQDVAKLKATLPDYRFYQDSTTCRESGKCPLLIN